MIFLLFQGKLNLNYKASDEAQKMYRALQILNPSPELSGEYKCTVSTFQKEESQSKKMVIFGEFLFITTINKIKLLNNYPLYLTTLNTYRNFRY